MSRSFRRASLPPLALLLAWALAPATVSAQATKEPITLDGSPPSPNALFTPAIRVGDILFLSGTLGTVPGQGLVEGGVPAETRQAIQNMSRVLEAAGASLEDLVKCTVYLADIDDFRAMNEVYRELMPPPRPTRTTVAVSGLAANANIEIECMAVAPAR